MNELHNVRKRIQNRRFDKPKEDTLFFTLFFER